MSIDEILRELVAMKGVRSALKHTSLTHDELKKITKNLGIIAGEIEKEKLLEDERLKQREKIIAKAVEKMRESGVGVDDIQDYLDANSTVIKTKKSVRPAKYEYFDENNERKTWTGQGRTPVAMERLMKSTGRSRETFLIKREK